MQVDLSWIITGVTTVLAIIAWRRNAKSDDKTDASQLTTVIVKLESIADDMKEVKTDVREFKGDMEHVKERLTIVEQSAKSAHKRIDGLHGEHTAD